MPRTSLALVALTLLSTTLSAADLPKVVLLGDSIRLGYAPRVAKKLEGKASVVSPAKNGGDSNNEVKNLGDWAIKEQPDVVHFNAGIHDIKKFKATGKHQVEPAQYESNLRSIVERLRKETKATVIFALTTPVIDDRAAKLRAKAEYELLSASQNQYNDIARRVMKELNVPINDLPAALGSAEEQAKLVSEDGIHMTSAGTEKLAAAVAATVSEHLPKATSK